MDAEVSNTRCSPDAAEKGDPSYTARFSASDYFLGIAQRIAATGAAARIALPGNGEVVMLSARRAYYASTQDMLEFCTAPAASFEVTPVKESEWTESGSPRRLQDLLWMAAFHASQERLIECCASGQPVHVQDVIRFRQWPNLPRLPQTPNTMRICALLTREPSAIMLISRKLGIDPGEVYQVCSAAYASGLVSMGGTHGGHNAVMTAAEAGGSSPFHEQGLLAVLFSRISGL